MNRKEYDKYRLMGKLGARAIKEYLDHDDCLTCQHSYLRGNELVCSIDDVCYEQSALDSKLDRQDHYKLHSDFEEK